MKNILQFTLVALFTLAISFQVSAQAIEATLLGTWGDESLTPTAAYNGRYNDVWGVTINNREIAIIGSTLGIHFIDVTDPSNPVELEDAFAPGADNGDNLIHRDFHDYNGYLYAVADEGSSTLQVIDLSGLPNSTEIVYDSNEYIRRAHNVFVDEDNARLYAFGARTSSVLKYTAVYSLADPANPVEMASYPADGNIPYAHDGYVRDNIAYLNCGNSQGFQIWDLNDPKNPILLEKITSYPQQGYNHSGWLDEVGRYYYLADETFGTDLKVLDICQDDDEDLQVLNTFNSESGVPSSIAHNLIVRCNQLYVSYYHEGLQVFDISDPINPERIAYYDTYDGQDGATYQGAWGIYPLFSSGTILISDMQTGLYIFDAIPDDCSAYTGVACGANVATEELYDNLDVKIFPQPASDQLNLTLNNPGQSTELSFSWYDLSGRLIQQDQQTIAAGENNLRFELNDQFSVGLHLLKINGEEINWVEKIIIE